MSGFGKLSMVNFHHAIQRFLSTIPPELPNPHLFISFFFHSFSSVRSLVEPLARLATFKIMLLYQRYNLKMFLRCLSRLTRLSDPENVFFSQTFNCTIKEKWKGWQVFVLGYISSGGLMFSKLPFWTSNSCKYKIYTSDSDCDTQVIKKNTKTRLCLRCDECMVTTYILSFDPSPPPLQRTAVLLNTCGLKTILILNSTW